MISKVYLIYLHALKPQSIFVGVWIVLLVTGRIYNNDYLTGGIILQSFQFCKVSFDGNIWTKSFGRGREKRLISLPFAFSTFPCRCDDCPSNGKVGSGFSFGVYLDHDPWVKEFSLTQRLNTFDKMKEVKSKHQNPINFVLLDLHLHSHFVVVVDLVVSTCHSEYWSSMLLFAPWIAFFAPLSGNLNRWRY